MRIQIATQNFEGLPIPGNAGQLRRRALNLDITDCLECDRLSAQKSEVEARIIHARTQLEEAVEAADGTSARKYNELEDLRKAHSRILLTLEGHERSCHAQRPSDDILTEDTLRT